MADDRDNEPPKNRSAAVKPADQPAMGTALRSVYQQTVEEAIPSEMLDLLSKLD